MDLSSLTPPNFLFEDFGLPPSTEKPLTTVKVPSKACPVGIFSSILRVLLDQQQFYDILWYIQLHHETISSSTSSRSLYRKFPILFFLLPRCFILFKKKSIINK